VVLTASFNLALNLVVAFVFILAFGVSPMWTWLLFAFVLLALFALTVAVALILSALYPRFRDLGIIWAVLSTALFYATPVLYPLSKLSGTIGTIASLNPLAPLFELTRRWVIDPSAPVEGGAVRILVPVGIYVLVWVVGVWVFRREAPRIAEAL
jgi:ABC-2 type transport system permease protein